jgi:ferredoxin
LCGLEIVEGGETLPPEPDEEAHIKELNRVDEKLRLSCHLEIVGDLVVRAEYW